MPTVSREFSAVAHGNSSLIVSSTVKLGPVVFNRGKIPFFLYMCMQLIYTRFKRGDIFGVPVTFMYNVQ